MASAQGAYLPDLGKCLSGDILMISWDDALKSILSHETLSIIPIFTDELAKRLLSESFPSFPSPSQVSKTTFETKTAAINVTPSENKQYDIEELKEDALWLSKECNLDEIESLRLTALEWQYRPELCLREGYSDAELSSLRDALGSEEYERRKFSIDGPYQRLNSNYDSQNRRRTRIIKLYLQEQVQILGVARELLQEKIIKHEQSNQLLSEDSTSIDQDIQAGIHSIKECCQMLENPNQWSIEIENIELLFEEATTSNLKQINIILEIILIKVRSSQNPCSSENVLSWLQLMDFVQYFSKFATTSTTQGRICNDIQNVATLVSLAILDPASTMTALTERTTDSKPKGNSTSVSDYFLDIYVVNEIQELLFNAANYGNIQSCPIVLAWILILNEIKQCANIAKEHRESHHVQRAIEGVATFDTATGRRTSASSVGSLQQSIYEDVIDKALSSASVDDPLDYMLQCLIEIQLFNHLTILAFDIKSKRPLISAYGLQLLQELLATAQPSLGYSTDLLSIQLAILSPTPNSYSNPIFEPSVAFLENLSLVRGFLDISAARFPYEALPFLRLSRCLANANIFDEHQTQYILYRLRQFESFTQTATKGFASYKTIREDENANLVELQSSVNMLDSRSNHLITSSESNNSVFIVPNEITGEVISEAIPPVIKWSYQYSALTLICKWLENHFIGTLDESISSFEQPEDVVVEIIGLLTTLLTTTFNHTETSYDSVYARQLCSSILDESSTSLIDSDVTGYIIELFEQELQSFSRRSPNTFNCNILNTCLDFLIILAKIRPNQFWSGISKSSLLNLRGTGGLLLPIVSRVEASRHDFTFLSNCTLLYKTMIQLILDGQSSGIKSKTESFTINRLHGSIILSITESIHETFTSIPEWSFDSYKQKNFINETIAECYCQIFKSTFGLGEIYGEGVKPTISLLPSAQYLMKALRPSVSSDTLVNPILSILSVEMTNAESISMYEKSEISMNNILELSYIIVRHGRITEQPPSAFELQLLDAIPILIRIPIIIPIISETCLKLICNILQSVEKSRSSSLLGHLGVVSSISYLNVFKHLNKNWRFTNVKHLVWKTLALFSKTHQQWLAVVLLTGSPPESKKKIDLESKSQLRGKSFLNIALESLSNIDEQDPKVIIAILEFVIQVQESWTWATDNISSHPTFLSAIISYIGKDVDYNELNQANHNKIVALVTEISTIHLHYAKSMKDISIIKTFLPLVKWLTSNSVEVKSYNTSLHINLARNFAMKYDGLDICDLKRTKLLEISYGDQYFYDLTFASSLLGHDPHWNNDKSGRQSFLEEFKRANLNLSLVDSELLLLQSMKCLCVDHCAFFCQDREIQKFMAYIIMNCLIANTQSYPSEKLFKELFQTRADLSLVLIQQLMKIETKGSDFNGLLQAAWTATTFRNSSYENAIINEDLIYWRSLLNIVLMALQYHVKKKVKSLPNTSGPSTALIVLDQNIPVILDIVRVVIGDGWKAVVANLQDQTRTDVDDISSDSNVGLKDLLIILTLFQTILRLPTLTQFASEMSEILISSGIIQSSFVLYSWSHILNNSENENEPFADVCLRMIVSLSSLPEIAEELAIQGVLNRVLTSRITQIIQSVPGGVSHIEKRPKFAPLFSLWAIGYLPLCLNLLHLVGGAIASEVSVFINQFPHQLSRASTCFLINSERIAAGENILTLAAATEAASLALISYILTSFRDAGASAAVDPITILPLANYDDYKKALTEDIRDVIQQKPKDRQRRVLARDEKELNWERLNDGNLLDKKIVLQLQQALVCLQGDEDDENDKS